MTIAQALGRVSSSVEVATRAREFVELARLLMTAKRGRFRQVAETA
jgi:hypothetical protein